MKNKKSLKLATLLLSASMIFNGGCAVIGNTFNAIKKHATTYTSQYGLDHKTLEAAVSVGESCRSVGAIVGNNKVITVYHQDGIDENDKFEQYLHTLGGSVLNPWVYLHTNWTAQKTNKRLDVALLETKDSLKDYKPLKIADAKLGECLVVSLRYCADPDQVFKDAFKDAIFEPYDRKAEITALSKEGIGKVVLKKPKITNIIPGVLTWHHDPEDKFHRKDSGSLILQDVDKNGTYELVGMVTSRHGTKANTGYFTRGSELEKLLQKPKPHSNWNPTLPESF